MELAMLKLQKIFLKVAGGQELVQADVACGKVDSFLKASHITPT